MKGVTVSPYFFCYGYGFRKKGAGERQEGKTQFSPMKEDADNVVFNCVIAGKWLVYTEFTGIY